MKDACKMHIVRFNFLRKFLFPTDYSNQMLTLNMHLCISMVLDDIVYSNVKSE